MSIKLVVGLGNPGNEYQMTRHNVGFILLGLLADTFYANSLKKFKGEYFEESVNGENVYFLKPLTFMNLSGESINAIMSFYKIKQNEVLIVYDDIESPFGTISFKFGGGLAGHNGLKSIKQHLKTTDFYRLKIGVSRQSHGNVASYVLSKYSKDVQIVLHLILGKAKDILIESLTDNIEKACKKYNKFNVVN